MDIQGQRFVSSTYIFFLKIAEFKLVLEKENRPNRKLVFFSAKTTSRTKNSTYTPTKLTALLLIIIVRQNSARDEFLVNKYMHLLGEILPNLFSYIIAIIPRERTMNTYTNITHISNHHSVLFYCYCVDVIARQRDERNRQEFPHTVNAFSRNQLLFIGESGKGLSNVPPMLIV